MPLMTPATEAVAEGERRVAEAPAQLPKLAARQAKRAKRVSKIRTRPFVIPK